MRLKTQKGSTPTMSKRAAIDTNVLVAFVDHRDKWYKVAYALMDTLNAADISVEYFDCVLNETISVLIRRAEEQKRSHEVPALIESLLTEAPLEHVTWISESTRCLFNDVVSLVRETGGTLNFHDALMALVCRELGIEIIVSFDEDFDRLSWLTRVATVDALQQALAPPTP